MPRNTGGRKAGAGSQSMLNYKGMPDYDAGNVHVQKNLNVAGHSVLNNVTVNRLTVTNAKLSTFEVPVVTGNPTTLPGAPVPTSAGLITVDSTAGNGKMYFSRLDATAATAEDNALNAKNVAAGQKVGGDLANSAIALITDADVTSAGSLNDAIDDAIAAMNPTPAVGDETTGSNAVVAAAKAANSSLAAAKAAADQKATDHATALTNATIVHNEAVKTAATTFEWVAVTSN